MSDLYSYLEVSYSDTQEEIKKAYRSQMLKHHPDKHKGSIAKQKLCQNINSANDILKRENTRLDYDMTEINKLTLLKNFKKASQWSKGVMERYPQDKHYQKKFIDLSLAYGQQEHKKGNKAESKRVIDEILNHPVISEDFKTDIQGVFDDKTHKQATTQKQNSHTKAQPAHGEHETHHSFIFDFYHQHKNNDWVVRFVVPSLKWLLFASTWVFFGFNWLISWSAVVACMLASVIIHMVFSWGDKNSMLHKGLSKITDLYIQGFLWVFRSVGNLIQIGLNKACYWGYGALDRWAFARVFARGFPKETKLLR